MSTQGLNAGQENPSQRPPLLAVFWSIPGRIFQPREAILRYGEDELRRMHRANRNTPVVALEDAIANGEIEALYGKGIATYLSDRISS